MGRSAIPVALLFLINTIGDARAGERPCSIAYRCSGDGERVWATDGKSCKVIDNECNFNRINCDRRNDYVPELQRLTKDECQKLCSSECPDDSNPICAYYDDERRTFPNECEMNKEICETGKTYSLFGVGPCKSTY